MANKKQSYNLLKQVRDQLSANGISGSIGGFLTELMIGRDPRPGIGRLFELVSAIKKDYPTQEEWDEIKQEVLGNPVYKNVIVSLDQSIKAAEKLIGYVYPRLNTVSGTVELRATVERVLSEEELGAFVEAYREVVEPKQLPDAEIVDSEED